MASNIVWMFLDEKRSLGNYMRAHARSLAQSRDDLSYTVYPFNYQSQQRERVRKDIKEQMTLK